jgi:hypothetical protein
VQIVGDVVRIVSICQTSKFNILQIQNTNQPPIAKNAKNDTDGIQDDSVAQRTFLETHTKLSHFEPPTNLQSSTSQLPAMMQTAAVFCGLLAATRLAAAAPAISFEPLNEGGFGCCRFGDSNANVGDGNYRQIPTMFDAAACQSECETDVLCKGFEVSEWEGCEIHWDEPSHATTTVQCQCMKKVVDDSAIATTVAIDTTAAATEAAATEAPATEAPATEAPATEAPATEAPATEAPAVTNDAVVTTAAAKPQPVVLSDEAKALVPAAGECAILRGYDFAGYDIADFANVLSTEQCAEICLADPACQFFTRTKWKGCHLKSIEAGYNAPIRAGVANVWGDTGRCLRAVESEPTDDGSGADSSDVGELKDAVSAAKQEAASHQAENDELAAENEELRAILDAIRALVA